MSSPVTMATVARAAGVHQTTVSLALRGHPSIPPATRERIEEIARSLGYRVNPLVSALVSSRNRRTRDRRATLGYVSADPESKGGAAAIDLYADFIEGVREQAELRGYGVDHLWIGDPKLSRARFNEITTARGIHGLIVAPLADKHPTLDLDWDRFAAVAYGYSMAEPAIHRVTPDFYHSMIDLVRRVRDAGWQRVGLILDENTDRKSDHLWLAAFLAEQRLGPAADRVEPLLLPTWSSAQMRKWFRRERPQVIVGLPNLLSTVGDWLHTNGGPAGKTTPLITLQRPAHSADSWPGITVERRAAGAVCVDFLVAMLHRNERGVPALAQNVLVSTRWFDGPSFVPASITL